MEDQRSSIHIINELLAKHFILRVEQQDALLAYIRTLETKAEMFVKLLEVMGQLEDMVRKPQYNAAAQRINLFSFHAAYLVETDKATRGGVDNPVSYNGALSTYRISMADCQANALTDLVWLLKNLAPILQSMEKFINENPGTKTP